MRNHVLRIFAAACLMSLSGMPAFAQSPPGVGYATVQEALEALKAKPGVRIETTKPDAWTIVNEPGGLMQWSFTPPAHAAYPAVVRRALKTNADGGVYIEMTGLCQASKAPCDQLMQEFKELNQRIGQSVRSAIQK